MEGRDLELHSAVAPMTVGERVRLSLASPGLSSVKSSTSSSSRLFGELREAFRPQWTGFHPRSALRCVPAVALAAGVGQLAGSSEWGVMAAAGAVSVGFGSFQELQGSRTAPMLFASCGMCVASWVGAFAGRSDIATVGVISLAGFLYVALSALGPGYSWITLQSIIWLVISTAYPASGLRALERGTCALAGGMTQMLFIHGFWLLERWRAPVMRGASIAGACTASGLRNAFDLRSCMFPFAIRATVTLGSAAALYRLLNISNGYWIPMTCVLVLRGDVRQSVIRGLTRMTGTIVGAGLATVVASVLRPSHASLAGLVLLFSWLAGAFLWVNYALFVTLLTAYVVFLLAFAGLPEAAVIHYRLLNTLAGGAIALIWHALFFPWEQSSGGIAAGQSPEPSR